MRPERVDEEHVDADLSEADFSGQDLVRCRFTRCSSLVVTLCVAISAWTDERVTFCGSNRIVPLRLVKRPLTVETIMWRTLNSASEWDGSMVQVCTSSRVGVAIVDGWVTGGDSNFWIGLALNHDARLCIPTRLCAGILQKKGTASRV